MSAWRNPYGASGSGGAAQPPAHRQRLAQENHARILRRKTEQMLMRGIRDAAVVGSEHGMDPGDLSVARLAEMRDAVVAEDQDRQAVVASGRHIRPTPARVSTLPIAHEDPEPFRPIRSVELGARCVAVTHAGATLWAGDADGSVRICDGASGEVVETIPGDREEQPANPVGAVTAMLATATHVWVGYNNGLVRTFDHSAFVHITEGCFHSGAVSGFAEAGHAGTSKRMVSAGDDGCVVVWDTEERNFNAMCKVVLPAENTKTADDSQAGISCVAAVGASHIYCGTLRGDVVVVNIVSAEVERVLPAHTDAVLGICTMIGAGSSHDSTPYVFTCSADCSLAVWKRTRKSESELPRIDQDDSGDDGASPTRSQGEIVAEDELITRNETTSPVLCVVPDTANKRVWTGEQDGTVSVWFASLDDGFALERKMPQLPSPVVRLHVASSIEALKVWSLGSNGNNKMWLSCTHRSEAELNRTIQTLKAIATQDGVELDKWRETVAKLQHMNARRKLQLARVLITQRNDGLRRRYMWMWRLTLMKKHAQRRHRAVSMRLAREHCESLSRRYFARWMEWSLSHQKHRIKVAYSRLLMHNAQRSSVHLAWAKMQSFARMLKQNKKRRDLILILGIQSQRADMRNVFRKWLKWLRGRQTQARKFSFVSAMLRTSDVTLTRAYYVKWQGAVQRRALLQRRVEVGELFQQQSSVSRLRMRYMSWRRAVLRRKTAARKLSVAQVIVGASESGLRLVYFRKWRGYLDFLKLRASESRKLQAEADLKTMKDKYADMDAIFEEKKQLDALEAELEAEESKLQEQDVMIKRLQMTITDIEQDIDDEARRVREKQESLAEAIATLISQLKAQVINFHQDMSLISQLKDKTKNVPITKLFLEAHQQVKRVVVEITNKPHLQGEDEPWPLTAAKLAAVPGHQWAVVLNAIKTMIITFDMMDRATRDGLQSDKEIVTNAHWLMKMADLSNLHRQRTLGRGAARVK